GGATGRPRRDRALSWPRRTLRSFRYARQRERLPAQVQQELGDGRAAVQDFLQGAAVPALGPSPLLPVAHQAEHRLDLEEHHAERELGQVAEADRPLVAGPADIAQ